jgi:hypothetical protein
MEGGRDRGRLCSVTTCDHAREKSGFCANHYQQHVVGLDYARAHHQLRVERGPASALQCVDCDDPAAEWSFEGGADTTGPFAYSEDLSRYVPRCLRCHRKFDAAARR